MKRRGRFGRKQRWERPPLKAALERIELPDGGRMRIVAVADTHGQPHPDTASLISELDPALIVHAGDLGGIGVLEELEGLAPTIAVRGNIDSRALGLPDVVHIELLSQGDCALTLLLTHVAISRVRLTPEIRLMAEGRGTQLVICGHSHLPWIGRDGPTAVFNPGANGPRRFALPITLGLIDISPSGVDLEHRDCESGERWEP